MKMTPISSLTLHLAKFLFSHLTCWSTPKRPNNREVIALVKKGLFWVPFPLNSTLSSI